MTRLSLGMTSSVILIVQMTEYALALILLFATSALTSFVATHIVKGAAQRAGLLDRPNERKLHTVETPRLGGLAIIFGFGFPLLLLAALLAGELDRGDLGYLFAILASASLIIGLGIYDDLLGANAPKKFLVQTAAAIVLVSFGFQFREISLAGQVIDLGVLGVVASVVWIVGVINAMNFIDGMDSLATLVAITIAVAFATMAILREDIFSLVIMTALAGSLIGFYPWNKPPAKIFMGDTGSLFIGLLLAAVSIARPSKSPAFILVVGPMLALALPVLDTLIVMRKRFSGPSSPLLTRIGRMFSADRQHVHHILVQKYGSTGRAILSIWMVTLLFAAAAVLTVVQETKIYGYTFAALAFVSLLVLRRRPREE